MAIRLKLLAAALAAGSCLAQVPPVPMGSSYAFPRVDAAPGQLITLTVEGISPYPPVRAPDDQDLPTSLSGISVGFIVSGGLVPILEINSYFGGCNPNMAQFCSRSAAITVQIPFEAQCNACTANGLPLQVQRVSVFQDGVEGYRFMYADTFPDQIHIVNTSDTFWNPQNYGGLGVSTGRPGPVVTHADGSPVSVGAPAQPGEELVIYAVGLGQTNPPLQTGKLVTAAVPTQTTYTLDFNFRPNALGTKPPPGAPQPLFAGATPGYVGIYQINVVVPDIPPGTPPCDAPSRALDRNIVESNLTVSVGGDYSFDAARICVAVPGS